MKIREVSPVPKTAWASVLANLEAREMTESRTHDDESTRNQGEEYMILNPSV